MIYCCFLSWEIKFNGTKKLLLGNMFFNWEALLERVTCQKQKVNLCCWKWKDFNRPFSGLLLGVSKVL